MKDRILAPRARPRSALVALMAVAAGGMAFAGAANAATFTPTDGPSLQTAITTANTNADPSNTIILGKFAYQPLAPMIITKNITIEGPGSTQDDGPIGQPAQVDGSFVNPPASDTFTVNSGVKAIFKSFLLTNSSDIGFAVFRVKGTAEFYNMSLSGNNGNQIGVQTGGTAIVTNTLVGDGNSSGIANQGGTLTLNNSTVSFHQVNGLSLAGGTTRVNNTIISNNGLAAGSPNCSAPVPSANTTNSISSDGSCNLAQLNTDPLLGPTSPNGGPTYSESIPAGSPAQGAGNPLTCPSMDQRLYVRSGACDIGAYQINATKDTTAPGCAVTALIAGPPKQQQVTASDSGSGLGPDAITNVAIDNGSVAFTPFDPPSTNGLVLTATKAVQAQLTHWSFTATDWAGNAKDCR